MKKIILIHILSFFTLISIYAQSTESPNFYFGIYMRNEIRKMKEIKYSEINNEYIKNLTIPKLEKRSLTLYLNPNNAINITTNQQPEFFFFFGDENDETPLTQSKFARMYKNYPFIQANSPHEFMLIRIFDMEHGRAIRLENEKDKFVYGIRLNPFEGDQISFTTIPIDNHSFKVVLNSKLPKGDYGFIYNKSKIHNMLVYDFRIE